MLILAVDPGLDGAIARLGHGVAPLVADIPTVLRGRGSGSVKREVDAASLNALLRELANGHADEVLVVIEQVAAMPAQGASSTFSLGYTCGAIRGVVAARGYRTELVSPARWKRYFGLGPDKEAARARALAMWPALAGELRFRKSHNRAEALLIAHYGLRQFT